MYIIKKELLNVNVLIVLISLEHKELIKSLLTTLTTTLV